MAAGRKKRKVTEKESSARIDELKIENNLLKDLVAELEENVEDAHAETDSHRAVIAERHASAESTVADLQERLHTAQERLAETEAQAAADLAAEVQRGETMAGVREAEVRAAVPAEVDAKVAQLRVQLEREIRADATDRESVWVMNEAAAAEERRVEVEQELEDHANAEKATWLANQTAASEARCVQLSENLRSEFDQLTDRLRREHEEQMISTDAEKEAWIAEQNRASVEAVATAAVQQAISAATTEVPHTY
jgi:hypothetical protein